MAKSKSPAPAKTEKVAASTPTKDRAKGHKARFLCALFDAQPKAKLSDAKLAAIVRKEYPESERPWEIAMASVRRWYNNGTFMCQTSAPKIPVPCYNDAGEAVGNRRPGPKVEAPKTKAAVPAAKPKVILKKKV